ncbi:unnamed protein product [Protopolystoma xenopodis]|uniref:Uncharacterized protein n=1 Tax=Protopolystoma xenopodis TaxID=117903 RepID=A0A448WM51_9PLAT|nr:unnamed protein product [Protopolystoma xenopodis]
MHLLGSESGPGNGRLVLKWTPNHAISTEDAVQVPVSSKEASTLSSSLSPPSPSSSPPAQLCSDAIQLQFDDTTVSTAKAIDKGY